jgi:Na+/melibiose symporter-like transporter
MKTVFDILLFPLGVLIEALVGILYPVESAKMRRHRKVALMSLVACIGVFGLVFLLTAIAPNTLAMAPLIVVGLILMFAFLIASKMCADEAENRKKRHGS